MSKRSNTNSKKVAPAPQPYCAHCFNIGKDESVFRSHFIRVSPDPSSRIVCPELLATECPYCFKTGHTKSRCPIILDREKAAKKEESRQKYLADAEEKAKKETKMPKVKAASIFAALMEDSDSEEDKPVMKVSKNIKIAQKIEEFPALSSSKKVAPTAPQANSYAAMTSKSKSEYENEQYLKSKLVKANIPPMGKLERTTTMRESVFSTPNVDFWADYDSENEEETDYIVRQTTAFDAAPKKFASQLSLAEWTATVDSDDEDW
jgi:hypothetical protein